MDGGSSDEASTAIGYLLKGKKPCWTVTPSGGSFILITGLSGYELTNRVVVSERGKNTLYVTKGWSARWRWRGDSFVDWTRRSLLVCNSSKQATMEECRVRLSVGFGAALFWRCWCCKDMLGWMLLLKNCAVFADILIYFLFLLMFCFFYFFSQRTSWKDAKLFLLCGALFIGRFPPARKWMIWYAVWLFVIVKP